MGANSLRTDKMFYPSSPGMSLLVVLIPHSISGAQGKLVFSELLQYAEGKCPFPQTGTLVGRQKALYTSSSPQTGRTSQLLLHAPQSCGADLEMQLSKKFHPFVERVRCVRKDKDRLILTYYSFSNHLYSKILEYIYSKIL